MELTREVVAAKWNEIVRNRLPADRGSNDWVWRLVQWATVDQAAEIERLRTENADQATRIEDLKSEIRVLGREVGRLENMPAPSLTTKDMSAQLAMGGYLIVEPREMDLFKYNNSACPVCGQAHP